MIQAVTFDLWDTIVDDDSDEPIRAELGLPPKGQARRQLFVDTVLAAQPSIGLKRALEGYDHTVAVFRQHWKVEHHTPACADRLHEGMTFLGIERPAGFDAMVARFERMEVECPPLLAPNIRACLENLHGRYPLGIISDAIVTPGVGLREILEHYELKQFFDVFVFSDEAGAAKPARKVFDIAAEAFSVPVTSIAHIGDREGNDIAGPLGVDATAILYTGVIDRGSEGTRAHAICTDMADMPGIIDGLAAR